MKLCSFTHILYENNGIILSKNGKKCLVRSLSGQKAWYSKKGNPVLNRNQSHPMAYTIRVDHVAHKHTSKDAWFGKIKYNITTIIHSVTSYDAKILLYMHMCKLCRLYKKRCRISQILIFFLSNLMSLLKH